MSWLSRLFTGGASTLVDSVGGVLDNLFTSDEERAEAERLLAQVQDQPHSDQRKTNMIEAAHRSVFVAGWRPAIGWTLAASLASFYLPQFLMGAVLWTKACWVKQTIIAYPLEIEGVTQLVLGMLGMAGIRTYEKQKGLSK